MKMIPARSPQGRLARAAGLALVCGALALSGCQKTYYSVLEKVGVEKRELLARRVTKARESQQEAQAEFRDALEQFQAVTGQRGGELEERYEELRDAYERSSEQAHDVRERIDAVESVADALLDEWRAELDRYEDAALRRRSSQRLQSTQREVRRLLGAMHRAERSLEPVLLNMQDSVLYLKHNLNAAALSGLDAQLPELERDVERLLRDMKASIAEADRFIAQAQLS